MSTSIPARRLGWSPGGARARRKRRRCISGRGAPRSGHGYALCPAGVAQRTTARISQQGLEFRARGFVQRWAHHVQHSLQSIGGSVGIVAGGVQCVGECGPELVGKRNCRQPALCGRTSLRACGGVEIGISSHRYQPGHLQCAEYGFAASAKGRSSCQRGKRGKAKAHGGSCVRKRGHVCQPTGRSPLPPPVHRRGPRNDATLLPTPLSADNLRSS